MRYFLPARRLHCQMLSFSRHGFLSLLGNQEAVAAARRALQAARHWKQRLRGLRRALAVGLPGFGTLTVLLMMVSPVTAVPLTTAQSGLDMALWLPRAATAVGIAALAVFATDQFLLLEDLQQQAWHVLGVADQHTVYDDHGRPVVPALLPALIADLVAQPGLRAEDRTSPGL